MEIFENIWLSLNIIFGLWSGHNWLVYIYAKLFNMCYDQAQMGRVLDLIIPASCLAYYLTFCQ